MRRRQDPHLDEAKVADVVANLPEDEIATLPIGRRLAVWIPVVVLVVLAGKWRTCLW